MSNGVKPTDIFEATYSSPDFIFYHHFNIKTEKSLATTPHYHKHFEIYFITEGSCDYFIDNRRYELQKGDIVMIPNGIIHSTDYPNPGHSRMLIHCSQKFIPSAAYPFLPSLYYLYRNPQLFNELKQTFEKIEAEYNHPDSMSSDVLYCYVHYLFFLIIRNMNNCEIVEEKSAIVQKAIAYMQNNYASPITLSTVAELLSFSPDYFSRAFKKQIGFGFNQYLNILRLQKAETLLKTSANKTIAEIAHECGFTDSNYFSKKFKETYKISPKKMQVQIKTQPKKLSANHP